MLDGFFHYSFVDGRLMGSEHPDARGNARERILSVLPAPRTAALLTLTRQPLPNYNIVGLTQHHLPMGDVPTRPQIAEAVKLVESHLVEGDRVWVIVRKESTGRAAWSVLAWRDRACRPMR